METLPAPSKLTTLTRPSRHGALEGFTMGVVRVRVHITDGQRAALIAVLDRSPDESVRVSGFTVTFDMPDPRGWLEARMAEWPRGAFPRASLHGVLRSLRSAIQGQVQPDLPAGQVGPDHEEPDLTGHTIIIETLDAVTAREVGRPDDAGRLAIVECHDGRRGKVCAVQSDLPDHVGIEDAARGVAKTYGARYAGVVK